MTVTVANDHFQVWQQQMVAQRGSGFERLVSTEKWIQARKMLHSQLSTVLWIKQLPAGEQTSLGIIYICSSFVSAFQSRLVDGSAAPCKDTCKCVLPWCLGELMTIGFYLTQASTCSCPVQFNKPSKHILFQKSGAVFFSVSRMA